MAINLSATLSADTSGFVESMNKIKSSTSSINGEFRKAQREAQKLTMAYNELDDEAKNSEFGKYLKDQIEMATQEAAKFADMRSDLQQNIKNLASDTSNWDAVKEGINVANTSVQAFASSLGIAKEDGTLMADALNIMAQAQTATNAVIAVGNALQKQSALMVGLRKAAVVADATATKIATAVLGTHATAMAADTVATGAATTATNLFKKALISTGVGAIVVAIGSLIAYWDDLASAAKKAFGVLKNGFNAVTDWLGITSEAERAAEAAAEAEKKRAEQVKAVTDEGMKQLSSESAKIGKLRELQNKINDVKLSEKERIKAMQDANKEAGKEIYNLKETAKYMGGMDKSISAYINNMAQEAKAKALLTKIGEEYIKQIQLEHLAKTEGLGPGNKKNLENIKNTIAMYEKELETIQKGIKTYNTYSDAKSGAGKSGGTHSNQTKKELDDVAKLEQKLKAIDDRQKNSKTRKPVKDYRTERDAAEKELKDFRVKIGLDPDPESIAGLENQLKELKAKQEDPFNLGLSIDGEEYARITKEIQDKIDNKKYELRLEVNKDALKSLGDLKKYFGIDDLTGGILDEVEATASKLQKYKAPKLNTNKKDEDVNAVAKESLKTGIDNNTSEIEKTIERYKELSKLYEDLINKKTAFDNTHDSDQSKWTEEEVNIYNKLLKAFEDIDKEQEKLTENRRNLISQNEEWANSYNNIINAEDEAIKKQEAFANALSATASIGQSLGSVFSDIGKANENMELQIAGLVANAVGQLIAQYAAIPKGATVWDWAAGAIAGLATLTGVVTQIKSLTKGFASGGIVGGTSTIGDHNLVRANAGEMILTNSQQRRLFAILNGDSFNKTQNEGIKTTTVIRGQDIYVTQQNYEKKYNHLI